jgi:hypothetical protein
MIGNSVYGKFATRVDRFTRVEYLRGSIATRRFSSPRFLDCNVLNADLFEVECGKSKITYNLPIQVAFQVYQLAKLAMLRFYYEVLEPYLDPKSFELVEMDTDSMYMALAESTLFECVRPELRTAFEESVKPQWFPDQTTPERAAYTKRTPGLMKREWAGTAMVALNSKTYFGRSEVAKSKVSSKGLQKGRNADILVYDNYKRVLDTETSGGGENAGFRIRDNDMWTYTQRKDALTYFYIKRKLLEDGVSTVPLDL